MMVYVAKSWPSKNQSELYIYPKTTLPYNNINYQQTHTWMHAASCRTKPVLIKKKNWSETFSWYDYWLIVCWLADDKR